jgi:hypothetical protein
MSPKRATQRRWIVHRTFEPDRLSSATLVQAYAYIVPYHIRVLRLPLVSPEAAGASPEPRSAHLSERAGSKITDLVESQEAALVIEPITKQEVG